MTTPAIGIDLGTTFSCVAVWLNGKIDIIANSQGNRITPSYVAFSDRERLIGEAAKELATTNPENTVFDAKRLIGRKFNDLVVQNDMKLWPFKVINHRGAPKIQVKFRGKEEEFNPEQISAIVLEHMKTIAEVHLNGGKVTDAVITVPAYFNDSQRQATRDAGKIAGLNVLRIINEPTAAAFAYGIDKKVSKDMNVLIFDFGGGTFDVSIVNIHPGSGSKFRVLATSGDPHLGGEDVDNCLVAHFMEQFQRKHKQSLSGNARAIGRLKKQVEIAKRALSSSNQANVVVDAIIDGIDFQSNISRACFEETCEDLFLKLHQPLDDALMQAKLSKAEIDEVVLVGGSSRIPKVQAMLQEYFGDKKLNQSIHPDEAVAYGAAVQAHFLSEGGSDDSQSEVKDVVLYDVTPFSLGIQTQGGIMANIIKRNSSIPCKFTKSFSTSVDNQETVAIQVFEGERQFTKDNNLLGTFELTGIAPAAARVPKIDVSFEVDADNILTVTAMDSSGNSTHYVVENDKGRLSTDEIDRMIREAALFAEIDKKERNRVEARHGLEKIVGKAKRAARDRNNKLTDSERSSVIVQVGVILDWLDCNQDAEKERYLGKEEEFQKFLTPFNNKIK